MMTGQAPQIFFPRTAPANIGNLRRVLCAGSEACYPWLSCRLFVNRIQKWYTRHCRTVSHPRAAWWRHRHVVSPWPRPPRHVTRLWPRPRVPTHPDWIRTSRSYSVPAISPDLLTYILTPALPLLGNFPNILGIWESTWDLGNFPSNLGNSGVSSQEISWNTCNSKLTTTNIGTIVRLFGLSMN